MNEIQCKMARAGLGLGVRELAELAKVSPDTIARLERGEDLRERTTDAVRSALEFQGAEFTNGDAPGVRFHVLKLREQNYKLRQRIAVGLELVSEDVRKSIELIGENSALENPEEAKALLAVRRMLRERQRALEAAGVEFANGDQPGVRMGKGTRGQSGA
jgi:transcriptional regulator with XRE-family HTH domain